MLVLPNLYKTTKTGATQVLQISVHNETIKVMYGQLNGKMQEQITTCTPKNVGKLNETTAQQQAELEAKAKWEKKIKEGYLQSIQKAPTINLPMKIHSYKEFKHKIKFPCWVSPKLNGVNAEYRLFPEPQVLSRGGEQYQYVESRDKLIFDQMKKHNISSLNGEIYLHGHHLQDIMSAVKKPSQDKLQPQFWAFDAPNENGDYDTRMLQAATCATNTVSRTLARSHEEIYEAHKIYLSMGYEGTVVRNIDAQYLYNTRSYDVLKLKDVQDAEFKIISHNIDKNGHPVFTCITQSGSEFSVKPKGNNSDRLDIARNINEYIGEWYKVEYEMLSKDGIPLKPVGIALRNCNNYGEPLQ